MFIHWQDFDNILVTVGHEFRHERFIAGFTYPTYFSVYLPQAAAVGDEHVVTFPKYFVEQFFKVCVAFFFGIFGNLLSLERCFCLSLYSKDQ